MQGNVEDTYRESFFKRRHKLNWRAPIFCDAVIKVFRPSSVVDVGCAIGDIVAGFRDRGISSMGIEGSSACLKYLAVDRSSVIIQDLRHSFTEGRWDLVTCLEVAEHIEPEFAGVFVKNLVGLGDQILLSAAPPGQDGHGHVNCQDSRYWDTFLS